MVRPPTCEWVTYNYAFAAAAVQIRTARQTATIHSVDESAKVGCIVCVVKLSAYCMAKEEFNNIIGGDMNSPPNE